MVAEPPSERLALFEWGVSDRFGWGVYGLNLLLAWADRTDLQPASLQPIDPAALDLDPLERHRLAPALARGILLQDGLRRFAGQHATSRHLLLEVVQNGLVPHGVPHGVLLRGSPSVGVAFLEDVRLDAAARARLRRYPLVVAGSTWNRDLLVDAGATRVERVLQGVDPSRFHPAPWRGLFPGRFVVLSGGKLEHRKGQDAAQPRPPRRKAAANGAVLATVLAALTGEDLRAVRDRAVLVFGMACCLRRFELVALTVEALERVPEGLWVTVRHSRTDQEGRGAALAVLDERQPRPVAPRAAWLKVAGITEGPVFRRLSRHGALDQ